MTSKLLSAEKALERLLDAYSIDSESDLLGLTKLDGRVLSKNYISKVNVPGHDNSEMDGYALHTDSLKSHRQDCEKGLKIVQRIATGSEPIPLEKHCAARIFTGAIIPQGANAVVMQEQCEVVKINDLAYVKINTKVSPNQHVRRKGRDIAKGQIILSQGTRLEPQYIGMLAAAGIDQAEVYGLQKIGIIASGSELVEPGEPIKPWQVYNSNRYVLQSLLQRLPVKSEFINIVVDDFDHTCTTLAKASKEFDLIISTGGMSVGEEDHVKPAIECLGKLDFSKVAVKPGKPLAYGKIGNCHIIGLPGNPVSTLVTFCLFVRPFILKSCGVQDISLPAYDVQADFNWERPNSRLEYARAKLTRVENRQWAALYFQQGSDVLSSTVWADGLVRIPMGTTIKRGEMVEFLPFSGYLG